MSIYRRKWFRLCKESEFSEIDPTFGLNRHVLNYSFIVCLIYQEECVTDLTIISFDLSADTRESEELEPADTCLCIVYTDKLLDVFTQEIFRVSKWLLSWNIPIIEISLSKDKVRSTCTAEECSGLLMVVFDLSSSPGVAGLSRSRSTAHKALCCVLEQDIVSSA